MNGFSFLIKVIELLCFLILILLGALVIGAGYLCIAPGWLIRWVGELIVDVAGRFE